MILTLIPGTATTCSTCTQNPTALRSTGRSTRIGDEVTPKANSITSKAGAPKPRLHIDGVDDRDQHYADPHLYRGPKLHQVDHPGARSCPPPESFHASRSDFAV